MKQKPAGCLGMAGRRGIEELVDVSGSHESHDGPAVRTLERRLVAHRQHPADTKEMAVSVRWLLLSSGSAVPLLPR